MVCLIVLFLRFTSNRVRVRPVRKLTSGTGWAGKALQRVHIRVRRAVLQHNEVGAVLFIWLAFAFVGLMVLFFYLHTRGRLAS